MPENIFVFPVLVGRRFLHPVWQLPYFSLLIDTVLWVATIVAFSLYYRVVVIRAPLQGLCYTVRDAVDWWLAPTTRWFKKGSNHSPLQFCWSVKYRQTVYVEQGYKSKVSCGCSCQRRCGFVVFRRTENVEKWRVKVYSLWIIILAVFARQAWSKLINQGLTGFKPASDVVYKAV